MSLRYITRKPVAAARHLPKTTNWCLDKLNTMSDIFISYKREEQAQAKKLANALELEGWTVWWDPKLRAGDDFDKIIEAVLNESRCVIVLWSEKSLASDYVRAEASEAMEQKKLVPVAIEDVTLPFRFKRLHTPKLVNWDGSNESAEFRKLVEDISAKIGKAAGKPSIAIDNRKPGTIFRDTLKDGTLGPEMVVIPAGTFQMGDIHGMGDEREKAVHTMRIQKPFAIARYQVTFDEHDYYAKLTDQFSKKDEGWGRGMRPVINVSWNEAVEYTKWLSTETGKRYRLPSEAEWEYAARSGGKDEIWAGTSDEKQLAQYAVFGTRQTELVGGRKPNGIGLHDMSGNVWEWVEDCWHENYDGAPKDGSAWLEAEDRNTRVLRGGAWRSVSADLRASYRGWGVATDRNGGIGFRLARDLE